MEPLDVLFVLLLAVRCTQATLYQYSNVLKDENALISEFWDPPHHITLNNVDQDGEYVVFFGSDIDRPLHYSCGGPCNVYLVETSSGRDTVTFSASIALFAPPPAAAGVLQLCIGPKYMFWKRPLVEESNVFCIPWKSSHNPQRNGGYLIQPNVHVEDSCNLEVYTWYMTQESYQQMREHNTTEVIVPLFDKTYWLPIVTVFYHRDKIKCYFKTPFYSERVSDEAKPFSKKQYSLVYKYVNYVEALEDNSGVYTMSCSGSDWDDYAMRKWNVELSKSLKITFIRGPKVYIEGQSTYTIHFPPLNTSASFNILVYSTSPMSTFKIERTDGLLASDGNMIVSESETQSDFSIVSKYTIEIPYVIDDLSGMYTVTAVNSDKESVTQSVEILRTKELQVVVSPTQLIVGEGDRVSFDCVVNGNLVDSIKWTRDFTSDKQDIQVEDIDHGRSRGLRLTFASMKMGYSGVYVCTAYNQFQVEKSSVGLAVWPPGSPMITDDHYSSLLTHYHHQSEGHQLNISDNELQTEWSLHTRHGSFSGSSLVLTVLTALVAAVMVSIGLVAGVCYGCQLLKGNGEVDIPLRGYGSTEKTQDDNLNSKDVWKMIRKHSLQLDKDKSDKALDRRPSKLSQSKSADEQDLAQTSMPEVHHSDLEDAQGLNDLDETMSLLPSDLYTNAGTHSHKHKSRKSKKSRRSKEDRYPDKRERSPRKERGEKSASKKERRSEKTNTQKDGEEIKEKKKHRSETSRKSTPKERKEEKSARKKIEGDRVSSPKTNEEL